MLSCLLINDSEKATLRYSQRVLAKYLPQVGPLTYMGSLSQEALNELKNELVGIRSRFLSVACFTLGHNHVHTLDWVVGSKKNFDMENGLYAFRTRTLKPRLALDKPVFPAALMMLTLRAAALTHDIGKMCAAFQDKLAKACAIRKKSSKDPNPGYEFMRHDALSYYVIRTLTPSGKLDELLALMELPANELARRIDQPSAKALTQKFENLLQSDLEALLRAMAGKRTGSRRALKEGTPQDSTAELEATLVRLIAFLSLTHHRLPRAPKNTEHYTYRATQSSETYFHQDLASEYKRCLSFPKGSVYCDDTGATSLGKQLVKIIEELKICMSVEDAQKMNLARFIRTTLELGRPLLVLSDYLGSSMKTDKDTTIADILANTRKIEDKSLPGDTLATHVRSVHRHMRKLGLFTLTLLHKTNDLMPELSTAACHRIDALRSPAGKFAWQYELFMYLKRVCGKEPVFACVPAETGAGKTIAAAQIMRALGSLRFVYCLGLRSLTLQTGQSYRKDLGLGEADLATVIGDVITQKAFNETQGSESMDQSEFLLDSLPQPKDWLSYLEDGASAESLADGFSQKKVDFISTPVVVCTIDQLIGIVQLSTVKHALIYLRLLSSDLILDEVDNYSPQEMKHLQKLCYLAGLARRNVVCQSATMGHLHTKALLEAFQAGVAASESLTGLSGAMRLVLGSNLAAPRDLLIESADGLPNALRFVDAFNQDCILAQKAATPKVKQKVLDASALDFDALAKEALALHEGNAVALEPDLKASVGFVRFNTVTTARAFAAHLFATLDVPSDTEISVVCYHSKYSALELSVIDRVLNTLTNRKGLKETDFSKEAIGQFWKPLANLSGKKNLVIIVVTTSILETGRDHDYDWAIVEPNSHRSLVQSAGRVRRHRGAGDGKINLSVIRYPAKTVFDGAVVPRNPVSVWSKPGPLTALNKSALKIAPTNDSYQSVLDLASRDLGNPHPFIADISRDCSAEGILQSDYLDGIRSTVALTPPCGLKNTTALLEQYALYQHVDATAPLNILDTVYADISGKAFRESNLLLTDWAYRDSFRGSEASSEAVYLFNPFEAHAGGLRIATLPSDEQGKPSYVQKDALSMSVVNAARCLLTLSLSTSLEDDVVKRLRELLKNELAFYQSRGFSPSELARLSRYCPQRYPGQAEGLAWYHPLLGFNHKPAAPDPQ